MPNDQETGPSVTAAWERHEVEPWQGEPVSLLVLPDASNRERQAEGLPPILHTALATPAVPVGAEGWPVVSLIVFLRRQPRPGERWEPLVDGGQFNLDATLTALPGAREALARATGAECPSIFARESVFRLVSRPADAGSVTPPGGTGAPAGGGTPAAGGEKILAEASVAGASPRASLSARLTAEEALIVEEALATGATEGRIALWGAIGFRAAAGAPRTFHLVGVWARIYDALRMALAGVLGTTGTTTASGSPGTNATPGTTAGDGGVFGTEALRSAVDDMLRSDVLQAFDLDAQGEHEIPPPLPDDAFRLFLAQATAAVLDRATPSLPPDDPGNRYRLAAERPMEAFTLDAVRRSAAAGSLRRLSAEAPLGDLARRVKRSGMPFDALVSFHVLDGGTSPSTGGSNLRGGQPSGPGVGPGGGPTSLAPRLVRTGRGSLARAPAAGRMVMAEDPAGGFRSLGNVLQTGARAATPSAQVLLKSEEVAVKPAGTFVKVGWLNDTKLQFRPGLPVETPNSWPVVGNAAEDPWPDRVAAGKNWYAPAYAPAMPDPGAAPDKSPFLFTFERTGVTTAGAVGIHSTLRFTLRRGLSQTGKAAPPPDPNAVNWTPTHGLSVILQLPFVSEADGKPQAQPFPVAVQQQPDGSLLCTLELVNQWARLLYGALAVPGFQAQPVRISVAYSFPAYVPARRWLPSEWLFMVKESMVPVARTAAERSTLTGQTHVDLPDAVIRYPTGEIRMSREAPRPAAAQAPAPAEIVAGGALAASASGDTGRPRLLDAGPRAGVTVRPVDVAAEMPPALRQDATRPPIVIRPPIKVVHPDVFVRADYFEQTILRETTCDLLVPCSGFGAAYRDRTGGGDVAIGCQDALALGRVDYKAYDEVPALATPRYRVFRSLQQVGRFLVLPARYRVGRSDAGAGDRAFAPAIAMFSVLDPDNDARSRIAVEATLEPDIPPFARQELLQALRGLSPSPAMDYPTESAKDLTFVWSLPPGLSIQPQALRVPNGFRVSLGTDLLGALMLENLLCRDGVAAAVSFQMPDGTVMPSVLEVGLANVTGTWGTGPFQLAIEDGTLRMTNRTERPVDLAEVVAVKADGGVQRVPAEVKVAEGASHAVVLPPGTAEAFPVYEVPAAAPAKLEEVRAVVDRVTSTILFFDLINYENHGLAKIELKARLKNVPGEQTVGLSGNPGTGMATMILPLTTYLANRTLEFFVRKTFSGGRTEDTGWKPWDLDKDGSVVSLTWELVAAPA